MIKDERSFVCILEGGGDLPTHSSSQMAQGMMGNFFGGPPGGGDAASHPPAAAGAARGGSARVEEVFEGCGEGGGARAPQGGGGSVDVNVGEISPLEHPDLADLKGSPLAVKIVQDIQQYG